MRKIVRKLKREFPFATVEITRGNHLKLQLPNGRTVIVGATPGCRNFLHIARADVRRQLRKEGASQ